MSHTWALLGPFSREWRREAIERMLADEPFIQVVALSGWEDVPKVLKSHRFDVLIAEFSTDGAPSVETILAEHPQIAVVSVNSSTFETHFLNLHTPRFLSLVRGLGQGEPDQDTPTEDEPRESAARPNVVSFPGRTDEAVNGLETHADYLAGVARWLDAALSFVLARSVGLAAARDIAGLTMDPKTARALLGDENSKRNVEALLEEMRLAEARLDQSEGSSRKSIALASIEDRFDLDSVDRKILWLTLAPEIDDRYARVIGVINDDLGRRRPTMALIAASIDEIQGEWDVAARLTGNTLLARFGLVSMDPADAAAFPRSQTGLLCPPDIIDLALTGAAPQLRSARRLAA